MDEVVEHKIEELWEHAIIGKDFAIAAICERALVGYVSFWLYRVLKTKQPETWARISLLTDGAAGRWCVAWLELCALDVRSELDNVAIRKLAPWRESL